MLSGLSTAEVRPIQLIDGDPGEPLRGFLSASPATIAK
jgi:hypothetical protein